MKATTFSIVTPSLNSGEYLEETLQSVLSQHATLEYIVVDSGSTDGTHEILSRHKSSVRLIRAPGLSQSAAINRGFEDSSGQILGWLNADDVYLGDTLETVARFFEEHPNEHFVFGDALAIDGVGREFGRRVHVRSGQFEELVNEGDFIVQPAAFWTRHLWEQTGPLCEDLEWTLDYEYWMRAAGDFQLHHLGEVLAKERLHGGAKTVLGGVERFDEMKRVASRHGGSGLPLAFRPEACATYFQAGLGELLHLRARRARSLFRQAIRNFCQPLKVLAFISVRLFFGYHGIARARLWANRLHSGGGRS